MGAYELPPDIGNQLLALRERIAVLERTQLGPSVRTSLPSPSFEGQEIIYPADPANGILWRFRYRGLNLDGTPNASAYKWEAIGLQAPLIATNDGNQTPGASGAYADLAPTLLLPLAGDWLITIEGNLFQTLVGNVQASYRMSGGTTAAAVDADGIGHADGTGNTGANTPQAGGGQTRRKNGLGAATTLTAQAKTSAASGGGVRWLSLLASPLRVG